MILFKISLIFIGVLSIVWYWIINKFSHIDYKSYSLEDIKYEKIMNEWWNK